MTAVRYATILANQNYIKQAASVVQFQILPDNVYQTFFKTDHVDFDKIKNKIK